jgi:CHAT domain-containing protein
VGDADQHLSFDQIEWLAGTEQELAGRGVRAELVNEARRHLVTCADCQKLVSMHEDLFRGLRDSETPRQSQPGPNCPEPIAILELAIAGSQDERSQKVLEHAAQCDYCGPALRQAIILFSEETTPEERKALASLDSVNAAWQESLAQKLVRASGSPAKVTSHRELQSAKPEWQQELAWRLGSTANRPKLVVPIWKTVFKTQGIAIVTGVAAAVVLGLWFGISEFKAASPDQLLVRAYTEKRTIEMRMEGANRVPLRQERSEVRVGDRMNRPALLKAESEAARRLQSNPDDDDWLHARGRANLLEGDPDAAIISLERARELSPDKASITIDLASAYFERGERLHREQDTGKAVDLLGAVLASDPRNEVALFNHAIALERQLLYEQAASDWDKFLTLYPRSDWAGEARDRCNRLQEKLRQQKERSAMPLEGSSGFVALAESGQPERIAILDRRIEIYLEIAMKEWLPKALDRKRLGAKHRETEWRALTDLARILQSKHGDSWLAELLRAERRSRDVQEAVALIVEAQRAIDVSDEDRAVEAAGRAVLLFAKLRIPAGQRYAEFQIAYSTQLSHRNEACQATSKRLLDAPETASFPWLQIQAKLESAICASTSDDRALRLAEDAFHLATGHGYSVLRSRSEKTLSGILWAVGDSDGAWRTAVQGLRDYWVGDLPRLRGYNFLTDLDVLAEDKGEWFLQSSVLKEAIPMIAGDPDPVMLAFEQSRLARSLLMTGDLSGAEEHFAEMGRLFKTSPNGNRKRNLSVEAEIGIAEIDLERGAPDRALGRLVRIRSIINDIGDDDLALDFFKTYGLALMKTGDKDGAEVNLKAALQLAEHGLSMVHDERDRLRWTRRNESTYRAMVALKLENAPLEALGYWESYKGASLRRELAGGPRDASSEPLSRLPSMEGFVGEGTVVVSYFLTSSGTAIWVADNGGTRTQWVNVQKKNLELLARHFAEHCSDPQSSIELVHREGRQLYQQIFLPIEPMVRGRRLLLLEPDGDLRQVPFDVLIDEQGNYLADRFAFAISPGIQYEGALRPWVSLSRLNRALIVSNPVVPGLSPLPDSEREAQNIAALFDQPRVLLSGEANYANVSTALSNSEVFHFSGHAVANRRSAGMILGATDLFDASKLRDSQVARSRLIVLSACSTADGRSGLFDDEDSMARRLVEAGVPEVVASRWAVDSAATSVLMTEFYRDVLMGNRVSDSLLLAARRVRSEERFTHPFYWAGFSIFGRG